MPPQAPNPQARERAKGATTTETEPLNAGPRYRPAHGSRGSHRPSQQGYGILAAHRAESTANVTTALSPTRRWQSLVPELRSLTTPAGEKPQDQGLPGVAERAADTAERLLLLLHYSIDWDTSWVAEEKHRKTYWDEVLPGRVRRASYRSATLDEWWSSPALQTLGLVAPRDLDRRLELAELLREPPLPVLSALHTSLPALLLRVRIIAEAVGAERKAKRG